MTFVRFTFLAAFLPVCFLLLPCLSQADISLGTDTRIKGYMKNETAFRVSHPRETTKVKNIFHIELKHSVKPNIKLFGLSTVYWDTEGKFEKKKDLQSWELYADIFGENLDLRLGRQQVVWGEADGLRMNDIINPQDFKEFILSDYIDSRIPLWIVKFDYYRGDFTYEGVIIPEFRRDRFARRGSEWEFYQEPVPQWLRVTKKENKKPAKTFKNWEWGLRVFRTIKGWELSCSYFYTWEDLPTFHAIISRPLPELTIHPEHHRLHVFGFTYNKVIGPIVLRGEGSFYLNKYFRTLSRNDHDGVVKHNFLFYMLGCDYHVRNNLDLNFQFVQRAISNYSHHLLEEEIQNTFTVFLQSDFFHETLKPTILFIYNTSEGDCWISPKVSYDVTDRWQIALGADFFEGGSKDDFYGQFDRNDRIYFEIKFGF
jgi:hypothetical protein